MLLVNLVIREFVSRFWNKGFNFAIREFVSKFGHNGLCQCIWPQNNLLVNYVIRRCFRNLGNFIRKAFAHIFTNKVTQVSKTSSNDIIY